ncbi:hypothetical protein ACWEKT_20150 [Nocardia takedensis]|uniref:hypothetical protein n=1 Tax=Nocardia takedensis TaxID=259390 RepID=UPI0012F6F883|nr:hypothetical protein [Nocardia takedensis]
MDLQAELDRFLDQRERLTRAMRHELRMGTSVRQIAFRVAPAFSRDVVKEYLRAVAIANAAGAALSHAGVNEAFVVAVTGIDVPREATLRLVADLDRTRDYPAIAVRAREVLLESGIDLVLGHRGGRGRDKFIDETVDALLTGGRVRLVKLSTAGS